MRKLILALAFSAVLLGLGACDHHTSKDHQSSGEKKHAKYYCTMHPDITSDQPGLCSQCGMDLVERDTTSNK